MDTSSPLLVDTGVLMPLLLLLLVISAFFSGSETALLGFDWLRLRYLARKGNRRARVLEKILSRKERLIGTILVGNNIANVAASAIATAVAISLWGESGIIVATVLMTILLLIVSEIAPKTFASRHSEKVGLAVAPIFAVLCRLFSPLVLLTTGASSLLLKLFGLSSKADISPRLSEEEIRSLFADSRTVADVDENKRQMLHGVFQIGRKSVREVMIPRPSVSALDLSTDLLTATRSFVETGYTRLPVYREKLDNIVGIVHARDVLSLVASGAGDELSVARRDTFFVPETMNLEMLLAQFQTRKTHMAMVVDEYGGFEGIVTLEDVLEEIVGDILDEHDLEGVEIRFLPGGEALVQGHASIRDVNEKLKLKIPLDVDTTLGGFAMTRLGHIPEEGESFMHGGVRVTIERMGRHRVRLVKITPHENGGETQTGKNGVDEQ